MDCLCFISSSVVHHAINLDQPGSRLYHYLYYGYGSAFVYFEYVRVTYITNVRRYCNKPKIESHYCRYSSSKRYYVETVFSTKADLYKAFNQHSTENSVTVAS